MNWEDKQMIACHIGVIANNLKHLTKALEHNIESDKEYALLDNLVEDIHLRMEEIEYTLHIWDAIDDEPNYKWEGYNNGWDACEKFYAKQDKVKDSWCECDCGCGVDDDPWAKYEKRNRTTPDDYKMD